MTGNGLPDRVLMVNKFHYPRGGAEHYMFRLAELLRRSGVDTLFFAAQHERNIPCSTEQFFPSEIDFGAPGPGVPRVRAAARAIYSRQARLGMAKLLDAEAVELAHLHNIYHQLSPSILAPLHKRRIPVVMTVHDYKLVCPVYTLLSRGEMCERCVEGTFANAVRHRCNRGSLTGSTLVAGETWLHRRLGLYLRGVDIFVTPSRFARGKLVAGGYPAERVRFIPNFVDVASFDWLGTQGSYFVYSGRLSHEKGVDVLLEAAARARVPLRIAGDGPARDALEKTAARIGTTADFVGHLGFEELKALVADARAVVVPSRWHENCPLTVIEAMAWGKPVVATRVGGIPELVRDGQDGLLVPPDDADALAAALALIDSSPDAASAMGKAARDRVQRSFGPRSHFEALQEVYAEARELAQAGRR